MLTRLAGALLGCTGTVAAYVGAQELLGSEQIAGLMPPNMQAWRKLVGGASISWLCPA